MSDTIETNRATARAATLPGQLPLRDLTLIGTFGREGDMSALLRRPGGDILRVDVGDRVGRATVAAIAPGTVILSTGGKSETLTLPGDTAEVPALS